MRTILGLASAATLGGAMMLTTTAHAWDEGGRAGVVEELVVYGRAEPLLGEAATASEGIVGYDDIQAPPKLRVGELVEAVPGMVATQHSGTGKANQYFIRGFNLDHGTDFAVSVEGVPINMRSHGHGQGYLDLNFLIPELVETTRFRRGPYSASVGDFSSAASVEFDLYDRLDEALISATLGEYGFYRALGAASVDVGAGSATGAVDFTAYDGPWDLSEDLEQFKLFGAYNGRVGDADFRLTLQSYDSEWTSTDQIAARAVDSGLISRLGNLDDDLGGETSRHALTGSLDFGGVSVSAYAVDYGFALFSNFTYFLDDPDAGDEFEQRDERRVYGIGVQGASNPAGAGGPLTFAWGSDLRFDDIGEVGLYRTVARERVGTVRADRVEQLSLSAWGESRWQVTRNLRAILGLRADWYDWDVTAFRGENSGSGDDAIVTPKLGLAWLLNDAVEVYASMGSGFHSNDVRGATISVDPGDGAPVESVPVLVRSNGGELGLRFERGRSLNATLSVFWLELDSELVYIGDAGATEPNQGSERLGVESTVFWRPADWLAINASYALTDARFRRDLGDGREIPGAVESTFSLGVNGKWANGWSTSARLRWLGEAPLVEDNSVRSDASLLVNAGVAWRGGPLEYRVDVFNVFDSNDNDIAYFYASRLPGESIGGVEDVHFHPLEPRSVRASVTWHWK